MSAASQAPTTAFVFLFFKDMVLLCSSDCPGTHSVDQASLQLRDSLASTQLLPQGWDLMCAVPLLYILSYKVECLRGLWLGRDTMTTATLFFLF